MHTDYNEPKVLYFTNRNVLYVRIPEMDTEQIPFYMKEMAKRKDKQIDRVVIDVRYNDGGSDNVWKSVLSAIIDEPVIYPTKVLFKNTPTVISYFNTVRNDTLSPTQKNDVIIGRDTLFYRYDIDTIAPAANTLAYKGNIYVLADARCYSSTKAFTSICERMNRLISVGQSIGNFGGVGINPFVFSLPYSKLIFRVGITLEGIDTSNIEDYYHDRMEIPVEESIQEVIFKENWTGECYGEDYLFNHDPVFQKVLEQKD
ncbi:MAG: S41 family peptidase [Prevotellaceae bacterium]|jgi:hypothetical protein|nr:S41 family peptidase [Prevotellaceae bacterium]